MDDVKTIQHDPDHRQRQGNYHNKQWTQAIAPYLAAMNDRYWEGKKEGLLEGFQIIEKRNPATVEKRNKPRRIKS